MKGILLIILMLLLVTTSAYADGHAYRLIVNHENEIADLTSTQVQRIFLGKTQKWSEGKRIEIVINTQEPAHAQFCLQIINKTPRQLDIYWRKALYSGRSKLPKILDNDADAIAYVGNNPAAIGIISNKNDILEPVKVIEIKP